MILLFGPRYALKLNSRKRRHSKEKKKKEEQLIQLMSGIFIVNKSSNRIVINENEISRLNLSWQILLLLYWYLSYPITVRFVTPSQYLFVTPFQYFSYNPITVLVVTPSLYLFVTPSHGKWQEKEKLLKSQSIDILVVAKKGIYACKMNLTSIFKRFCNSKFRFERHRDFSCLFFQ